jgi:hypothetical protein
VGRWRPYFRHLDRLAALLAEPIAAYEGQSG